MQNPSLPLGKLSLDTFLSEYWQKKPLVIRQAFPDFISPVDGDELAGLSLEEELESRLILEDVENASWELRCGPFTEETFANLPEKKWTLLVQAVDHWLPEVSELREHFRFIPDWRFDDVMISYAVDGGSVGPHFDQYDVFLLQASGRRKWKIGQKCSQNTATLNNTPLHIVADFEEHERWILEPGDMLYLPPQIAHWGTALGDDCITLSIGYRAPAMSAILTDFAEEVASHLTEDLRYTDPDMPTISAQAGAIAPSVIDHIQQLIMDKLNNRQMLEEWFGRFMTLPKYLDPQENLDTGIGIGDLPQEIILVKALNARLAYLGQANPTQLFINGDNMPCSSGLAITLSQSAKFTLAELLTCCEDKSDHNVINSLLRAGILFPDDD